MRRSRWLLGAVLVAYLVLGAMYALRTPLWQAPDEPAHYNYIAQIVATPLDPPEIEPGDYPVDYLERLKRDRFPSAMPVDGIEYEDYQPPAYYYVASVPARLAGADTARRVRAVRLLGVLLGAITVCLAWAAAGTVYPADTAIAAGTAAFVAFLPMHLAVTAAVNNDALANVLSAAIVLLSLRRVADRASDRTFAIAGGALVGLALLTKASVYPLFALILAAEALRRWRAPAEGRGSSALAALAPLGLGLAVALPWLARNASVYGLDDPLGNRAHNRVVTGQPRTSAWIAEHGWDGLIIRLASFTFESFWGVFGWMGVFLDTRIYQALALLSAMAFLGLLRHVLRLPAPDDRRRCLALLGFGVLLSAGLFLAYNAAFVQHQGRYLFSALIPIAVLFVVGLRELPLWLSDVLGFTPGARTALAGATLFGFAVALAGLAWLSLTRYVIPGLS